VEVAVPVVEDLFGEIRGAHEPGEVLAREGVVAAVDVAEEILARHGHVLGIAGAEEVVTLVGAGAAFDAGVEEHLQGAVLADELAHLRDGGLLPVFHQLAGIAEGLLMLR
jgi:hypothetical protein